MKQEVSLDLAYLKSRISYEPETGKFLWLSNDLRPDLVGVEAGCLDVKENRIKVMIDQVFYKASQLAWFYMKGVWPDLHVFHIDGNTANNKWNNLTKATIQDIARARKQKVGISGHKGVFIVKSKVSIKYRSRITISRKAINLGTYELLIDAAEAYKKAAIKAFGEFYRD